MSYPKWAERLTDELARRGVPARFRRRLLAELQDHADDLTDEGLPMSEAVLTERLGDPAAVAATAADNYRRATWVARHPLLVFGLLPVPALVLVFVLTVLGLELTAYAVGTLAAGDPETWPRAVTVRLAFALQWGLRFVPFVLLAWLFTRLYLRHQVRRRWLVVAAAQVLFLAGTFVSTIRYSDVPGQSAMMLGFAWVALPAGDGWAFPYLRVLYPAQLAQAAVPAAVGWWMLRAARHRAVVA